MRRCPIAPQLIRFDKKVGKVFDKYTRRDSTVRPSHVNSVTDTWPVISGTSGIDHDRIETDRARVSRNNRIPR